MHKLIVFEKFKFSRSGGATKFINNNKKQRRINELYGKKAEFI